MLLRSLRLTTLISIFQGGFGMTRGINITVGFGTPRSNPRPKRSLHNYTTSGILFIKSSFVTQSRNRLLVSYAVIERSPGHHQGRHGVVLSQKMLIRRSLETSQGHDLPRMLFKTAPRVSPPASSCHS